MWLHFSFSIVFVYVIGSDLVNNDSKNITEHTEAIFAGVIKNISRVNNVLQELINNYEHLQKIYKSQENLESATSDDEVDEVYKNRNKKKSRAVSNPGGNTGPPDFFPATQIIWDENESESNNSESNDSEIAEKEKSLPEKISDNSYVDKGRVDTINYNNEPEVKAKLNNPKTAEIIFVDTHKITANEDNNQRITTPDDIITKTRYSKVSQDHQEPNNKHKKRAYIRPPSTKTVKAVTETNANEFIQTVSDTSAPERHVKIEKQKRKVEKKIHSESFSHKNIWDEIINNKPIQLEAHNELVFEKGRKVNNLPHLRTGKTALAVLITNRNRTANFNKDVAEISDSDEIGTSKEDFQAQVLREAYGDACLKVVKKKCFKACKEASKSACRRFNCKSSFKSKFLDFSKEGCVKEFNQNCTSTDCLTEKNVTELQYKAKDDYGDMTREGYLRDCLPLIQQADFKDTNAAVVKTKLPNDETLSLKVFPLEKQNFNTLRDRYEKACQKISRDKCDVACKYAYTKTCESLGCESGKRKAFKKGCKEACESAYSSRSSDSDSSSDSSGSDSDSDDSGSESSS